MHQFTTVFTARCYASAVLAMGLCLSVCVCLSQVGERESIYLPHDITRMFKNNITEAGCQRGTDAYQCWLPLQLKSCNIGTRMHKKHKKEKHS